VTRIDAEIIKKLIRTTPSEVCTLVIESNTNGSFVLTGTVLELGENSLLFKTRAKTAAIDFRHILQLCPLGRREF
jgi:hypothetical protein